MTKSELKTGMVVTYRDGREAMVFKDCADNNFPNIFKKEASMLISEEATWLDLRFINEDLLYTSGCVNDLDIIMVECVRRPSLLWQHYDPKNYTVIWERNPPKKMTVAEIEAILGYRVEIVSEKEN